MHDDAPLLRDALAIWHAGLAAVRPERLLPEYVAVDHDTLWIAGAEIPLNSFARLVVVGAGKAGAAMTLALEHALGPRILAEKQVSGWVNVPDDCVVPTQAVRLHGARPAGCNEPTAAGVAGAQAIERAVATLNPRDLCLALVSGGGSALLPAPLPPLSLADKRALTQELSARGAAIAELNAVRRELSSLKGGGLARACRAGRLETLLLSDVLGDDLALIASGPTVDRQPTPELALEVLRRFELDLTPAGRRAAEVLRRRVDGPPLSAPSCRVRNTVIGNNAVAVDAAGVEAERRGYSHAMLSANQPEGAAEDVGRHLVAMARRMRAQSGPDCLITGGEPTVALPPSDRRGRGGRNQQLCLAALVEEHDWHDAALVSGGTDGEDGPTDAAGAWVDAALAARSQALGLDPLDALRRCDAYSFFAAADGLLKTGPTHTNVCDVRVLTVRRRTP